MIEGRRTTYFKQYFRHVRRGARRIGASSESRRVDPLAFVNADGRTVVVMKADGGADVYVKGLPAARDGVSLTTERARGVEAGAVTLRAGELLHAGIPAEGVFTVYAK